LALQHGNGLCDIPSAIRFALVYYEFSIIDLPPDGELDSAEANITELIHTANPSFSHKNVLGLIEKEKKERKKISTIGFIS